MSLNFYRNHLDAAFPADFRQIQCIAGDRRSISGNNLREKSRENLRKI